LGWWSIESLLVLTVEKLTGQMRDTK